jgi:hypothetical protein
LVSFFNPFTHILFNHHQLGQMKNIILRAGFPQSPFVPHISNKTIGGNGVGWRGICFAAQRNNFSRILIHTADGVYLHAASVSARVPLGEAESEGPE